MKNPQADLTWQKGAKRRMANLERFIEELMTFNKCVMPEATLVLFEPYLYIVVLSFLGKNPSGSNLAKVR